jgi:hypothetical protein
LQPPDNRRESLEAIAREVIALEQLCGELEQSVDAHDWPRIETALRDCRRVTHALKNALHDSEGQRDPAFEKQLNARVKRILDVREAQLTKLRAYNEAVGAQLRTISKWKSYARSIGGRRGAPPSMGLDRIQ